MGAILKQELAIALRAGSGVGLGLAFYLIIVLLSALASGRDMAVLAAAAPGTLWIGALLAGLLSLDRMFQADLDDGNLDVLALAPQPLEAIVAVKILAHWLTAGLPLVVLSPVMALMLQLQTGAYGWMIASLSIGTLSLSAIGAIGAALTVSIQRGGLLLSLLVMPLYVPSLIFGVRVIELAADGVSPQTAFLLLAALTLFCLALAPIAAAAAIRVNMR